MSEALDLLIVGAGITAAMKARRAAIPDTVLLERSPPNRHPISKCRARGNRVDKACLVRGAQC